MTKANPETGITLRYVGRKATGPHDYIDRWEWAAKEGVVVATLACGTALVAEAKNVAIVRERQTTLIHHQDGVPVENPYPLRETLAFEVGGERAYDWWAPLNRGLWVSLVAGVDAGFGIHEATIHGSSSLPLRVVLMGTGRIVAPEQESRGLGEFRFEATQGTSSRCSEVRS